MKDKITYGLQTELTDELGTMRTMVINELESGRYLIGMKTKHANQDDPVVTSFSLSKEGVNMLSQLLDQVHCIRDFPIPEGV